MVRKLHVVFALSWRSPSAVSMASILRSRVSSARSLPAKSSRGRQVEWNQSTVHNRLLWEPRVVDEAQIWPRHFLQAPSAFRAIPVAFPTITYRLNGVPAYWTVSFCQSERPVGHQSITITVETRHAVVCHARHRHQESLPSGPYFQTSHPDLTLFYEPKSRRRDNNQGHPNPPALRGLGFRAC